MATVYRALLLPCYFEALAWQVQQAAGLQAGGASAASARNRAFRLGVALRRPGQNPQMPPAGFSAWAESRNRWYQGVGDEACRAPDVSNKYAQTAISAGALFGLRVLCSTCRGA